MKRIEKKTKKSIEKFLKYQFLYVKQTKLRYNNKKTHKCLNNLKKKFQCFIKQKKPFERFRKVIKFKGTKLPKKTLYINTHTNTKKNTNIIDTYEYGTMRTKTKYIYAIR